MTFWFVFSLISNTLYSQCLLPYGEKTFTIVEQRHVNPQRGKRSILEKSVYSTVKVEIIKLSTMNILSLSGGLVGNENDGNIVAHNCESVANNRGVIYTMLVSYPDSQLSYSLITDNYGNYLSLTMIKDKTLLVLKN